MKRIVLVSAFGNHQDAEGALGLGRSLRLLADPIPRVIVTDQPNLPWKPAFDQVIVRPTPFAEGSEREELDADAILIVAPSALSYGRVHQLFEEHEGVGFARDAQGLAHYAERGAVGFPVPLNGCVYASELAELPSVREGNCWTPLVFFDGSKSKLHHRRELRMLAWLEAYEQRTEYGHVTHAVKWRRSIEKRVLRKQGRI